jgi:LDH2 family malate/lactate/ureidoglycolate dehydrogenase
MRDRKLNTERDQRRYQADRVYAFVERALLKSGVEESGAKATAKGLWQASLRGVDSHGIRLLPHYLQAVKGGRINPNPDFRFDKTSASTGMLDADHGFGHAAGILAIRYAMDLAREAGSGHVAVRNSSHCGSMAYFALEACAEDMIGTAYTNATPKMRSANATKTFFGTNPVCMAAPMASEGPFCYDGATTFMSANKIRVYGERGLELPAGCGADEQGIETRDPEQVTQLLPIGDYKGFGFAMMVDVLCGLLTSMPTGDNVSDMFKDPMSEKRHLGQFYGALRVDAFENPERFKTRLQDMADRIRREPRQDPDVGVQVPGDPEKAHQADREVHGIPISSVVIEQFDTIARNLGTESIADQE